MNRQTSNVKREVRILGLDTCGHGAIVGVISRGGSYLDGVLIFPRPDVPSTRLARDITETKYYPELKATMLHDPKGHLNMSSIERTTKLPSILVSARLKQRDPDYRVFCKNGRRLWFKSRFESLTLNKILASTWVRGGFPEPLRTAHLLAKTARSDRVG